MLYVHPCNRGSLVRRACSQVVKSNTPCDSIQKGLGLCFLKVLVATLYTVVLCALLCHNRHKASFGRREAVFKTEAAASASASVKCIQGVL